MRDTFSPCSGSFLSLIDAGLRGQWPSIYALEMIAAQLCQMSRAPRRHSRTDRWARRLHLGVSQPATSEDSVWRSGASLHLSSG